MATPRSALLPLLACLLLLCIAHPARSFSDKCSACQAVAAELEVGLANERPRNHLDMRHRLDSKGQREGKLIDYKVSELRVVELLDGLCTTMKGYTFEKTGPGKGKWMKIEDMLDSIQDRQEAEAYSKQMTTYCGRLLEETEEELEERIRNGSVKVGEVHSTLCWELSQHCNSEMYVFTDSAIFAQDEKTRKEKNRKLKLQQTVMGNCSAFRTSLRQLKSQG